MDTEILYNGLEEIERIKVPFSRDYVEFVIYEMSDGSYLVSTGLHGDLSAEQRKQVLQIAEEMGGLHSVNYSSKFIH